MNETKDRSLRSGERQVHTSLDGIEKWHKWRYEQTLLHIKGKLVLDAGCGCGYGTHMMSAEASHVDGIDDSAEAIEFAMQAYRACNINYYCDSFLNMAMCGYDVIVAFEFIEHVEDTDAVFEKFVEIGPDKIILSVPHITTPIGGNKFHYRHYGMDEIVTRFYDIGYKPQRAELIWFGTSLDVFCVAQKGLQRGVSDEELLCDPQ